jgi:tetratricopeptide (TPR) repeat protein
MTQRQTMMHEMTHHIEWLKGIKESSRSLLGAENPRSERNTNYQDYVINALARWKTVEDEIKDKNKKRSLMEGLSAWKDLIDALNDLEAGSAAGGNRHDADLQKMTGFNVKADTIWDNYLYNKCGDDFRILMMVANSVGRLDWTLQFDDPHEATLGDTVRLKAIPFNGQSKSGSGEVEIKPELRATFHWKIPGAEVRIGNPIDFTPTKAIAYKIPVELVIPVIGKDYVIAKGDYDLAVKSKPTPDTKEKPPTPPKPAPKVKTDDKGIHDPAKDAPAAAPSSGTVPATGAWVLEGVKDKTQPSKGFKDSYYTYSPGQITFKGSSLVSNDVETKNSDGTAVARKFSGSWTEFPTIMVPGAPATIIKIGTIKQPNDKAFSAVTSICETNVSCMDRVTSSGTGSEAYPLVERRGREGGQREFWVRYEGPGGTADRTYTYVWKAGGTVLSQPSAPKTTTLSVQIEVDKPTIVPGEKALLKATATGGVPPFTYSWTGPVKGAADKLAFTADKPGTQDFTVTVSDSKGATATASASVTIEAPTVTIRRTTTGPVVLGLPYGFQAQLSAAGKPLPGAFVYRWEPHPAVTYSPHEGASTQTTAVFTRPGTTLVWVDVLRQEGPVLVTVAESEQIEIDVVSPELSLAANPSAPFTGQEVRINVTMNPAIQDKYVTFWWEIQGNALNAGPVVVGDAYSRAYTYKPKDTAPVTVTVHSKSKDGGDDLGQKSIAVTAKLYQVKIGEPRLMGPPPRVWSEQAKKLVEVPRGIGTFQEFFVNASISPPPPDSPLRYDWKSQPEGCSIYSPGSQETRSSASQAGTFNISVTIRDSQNIVLGSGARTVTIVAPAPEPKKAEPPSKAAEAMAKLKEASALAVDGKLDEAIVVAEQAAALDPNSRPISSYLQQLKATKAQKLNLQQQAKPAAPSPTAPPQSKTDAAAPSKTAEAITKLKEASALAVDGKLDEAIAVAEQAAVLDPNSKPISSYLQQLKATKAQQLNPQQQNKAANQAQKLQTEQPSAAGKQKAADLLNQAKSLYKSDKLIEAIKAADEAVNSDPTNTEASRYATDLKAELDQIIQSFNNLTALAQQGRLTEAFAELDKVKKPHPRYQDIPRYETWLQSLAKSAENAKKAKDDEATAAAAGVREAAAKSKKAETANQQSANQAATQHLDQALSLGKEGRLDEASAEVAEAKKIDPSHTKIPEFERWISQLRQQQDAAKAAAASKKAETANQQAAKQPAAQKAPEAKKEQGPLELDGTQWGGTASITAEGETISWPFRISIDGTNITGEMTVSFPGIEGSQKVDLHGMYNSARNAFTMTVIHQEVDASIELALGGAAKSAALAEGTLTMKVQMQGLPDSLINGTWRMSRR